MARTKLTLQDVARVASERNGGKGGRALQRIAKNKGLTLSYATVDRILAGKYESTPKRPTIEALAVLAEMPVEEVYAAAGLPLPMASLAEQLPDGSDNLSTQQRRVVLDVIRGFIRDNDRMAQLEQERDERVPERTALVELVNTHDDATLEAMDLDDLYDLAHLLGRAVPSLDETNALVQLATRTEQIIERREHADGDRSVADLSQPDGVTPSPRRHATSSGADTSEGERDAGSNAHHRQRGSENEALRDDRPWEQDEYSLAAKRGRDRGREARQQQDREAEDGGV